MCPYCPHCISTFENFTLQLASYVKGSFACAICGDSEKWSGSATGSRIFLKGTDKYKDSCYYHTEQVKRLLLQDK